MRRMIAAGQGLVAAMEAEADKVAQAEAAKSEAIGDNAESLETDMLEVGEDQAEADDLEKQTDDAGEVVEALESIREAMGIAAQNGGMDRHSAAVVSIAVGQMCRSVGVRSNPMPALESFGGTSSRVGATQLAMEGIKELAAKVWEAIIAAIKKAIAFVQEFYTKVFKIAEKLAERAKGMKAKIDAVNTKGEPKDKNVKSNRLVKALQVAGAVDVTKNLDNFAGNLVNATGLAEDFITDPSTIAMFTKPDAVKTFAADFNIPGFNSKNLVANPETLGFTAAPAGMALYRMSEMLGGMAVVGFAPKDDLRGNAAVDAFAAYSMVVGPFNPKAEAVSKEELPTLNGEDATKVAEAVVAAADNILKYRAMAEKLSEAKKKLLKAASDMSKKDATEDEKKNVVAAQKVARSYCKMVDQPAIGLMRYYLSTCKSLLDYIEESLKQYTTTKA